MNIKWKFTFMTGAFAVALGLFYILLLRSVAVQITPPPETRNEPYPDVSTQEMCETEGGRWITSGGPNSIAPSRVDGGEFQPYCQGPLAFERQQQIQLEDSRQTSLLVFAIGGALAVAASLLWPAVKPIAPGLMVGGIVAFFITAVHVWMLSASMGRLLLLILLFVGLAAAGLHAFKDKK